MQSADKIEHDINQLRESISLNWADLSDIPLSKVQRDKLRQHISLCALELNALIKGFDHADRIEADNA